MLNLTPTVVTSKKHLAEKGIEIDKDDLTKTVKAVRNAMDEVVPGPMAVMSHGLKRR
jgi:hypothetical protein